MDESNAGGIGMIGMLVWLAIVIFMVAAVWKVFAKAGKPGWAALIPFYNYWVMVEIAGKPPLWFVLMLIPFVNFVMLFLIFIEIAKRFGKGAGFGVGMVFLPFIFFPMLAWGDATYSPALGTSQPQAA